ncbi:MAG: response regulator transcription factor, partial [Spirochaetales bacterium]|nr:response regulator transcription factor [Spirochaetales bacterium]
IVILHIVSSEIDWLRLISGIKEIEKGIKIIVYSSHLEHKFIFAIMGAGASGYVAESGSSADFRKALDFVLNGEIYLSREILAGSDESQRIPAIVNSDISLLSEQESIVVRMISEGRTTKEIAFDLSISRSSVATYRSRIMEKLDIYNDAGLIKFAIKTGLTSLI